MPPVFRCSELDRLMECPGSGWLPRKEDYTGFSAAWGNVVHDWLETGLVPDTGDGKLLQKRIEKSGTDRNVLWPGGEHEAALAYNLVSDKVVRYPTPPLPPGISRKDHIKAWKLSFDTEWMTGSLDFAGELMDSWWVDDLKTGRDVHWGDYQWQQTAYAIMWSTHKHGGLVDGRSTVTHWPRYPVARPPNRMGALLTTEQLTISLDKLKKLRHKVLEADNKLLVTGSKCLYCPSAPHCPELQNQQQVQKVDDFE